MSNPTKLQQLSELKIGALILVEINGQPTSGKFEEVLKTTGGGKLFKYREQPGNMIRRAAVEKFISVAPAPEEGGKVIPMRTANMKPEPATKLASAAGIPEGYGVVTLAAPAVAPLKKGEKASMDTGSGHKWEKQNLMTIVKGGKSWDNYKCLICGMEGKRFGIGSADIEVTKPAPKGQQCQPIPPLSRGISHIKLLINASFTEATSTLTVGAIYPVIDAPAEYAKFAADVWIEGKGGAGCRLFRGEWEQVSPPMQDVPASELPAFVSEVGGSMKVSPNGDTFEISAPIEFVRPEVAGLSEFGAKIVETVGVMENGGLNTEPISVASLAEKMEESPKKVAAAFTALNKTGLVEQLGEKGARLIQLTNAGWEYINGPARTFAVEEGPVGEAVPEKEFKMMPEHISALNKLSETPLPITEIFDANALRDIELARGSEEAGIWVVITPAQNSEAYFEAALGPFGAAAQYFFTPELFDKSPVEGGKRIQQPEPTKKAAKAAKAEKPAKAAKIKAEPKETGPRSKGGRPAPGEKSVRELVLDEVKSLLDGPDNIGPSAAMKAIAEKMGKTVVQVNNAFTKLSYAGYFAIDDSTNRIAAPLALTEKGRAGYTNNYGKNIRPEVEKMIAAGKTDIEIARALGCEHGYIHDVRTNRGKKVKEVVEAVTE